MKPLALTTALISLSLLSVAGCAGPKEYQPYSTSQRTLFLTSPRTVGPEPVYARTRWVRPSEVLPQREHANSSTSSAGLRESPSLRPVFELSLKNATLESMALVRVIIDHENKEVRFLPASAQSPKLFEE